MREGWGTRFVGRYSENQRFGGRESARENCCGRWSRGPECRDPFGKLRAGSSVAQRARSFRMTRLKMVWQRMTAWKWS